MSQEKESKLIDAARYMWSLILHLSDLGTGDFHVIQQMPLAGRPLLCDVSAITTSRNEKRFNVER